VPSAFLGLANISEQPSLWVAALPLSLPLAPLFETENPLTFKG
jgi:hypothetical protein